MNPEKFICKLLKFRAIIFTAQIIHYIAEQKY